MKQMDLLKELNVLYVDDDIKACESLGHILKYYFQTVFIAHNGQEALEVYKKNACHLLIVDYDMPIMNGYEFLSRVREEDDEIQAMIMSSYDDKVKLKNAIKLHLLEYITKPYELRELQDVLQNFITHIEKKALVSYQITSSCYYEFATKTIIDNEKRHKLTSYEVKIFEYLLKNRDKLISYEILLDMLDSTNHKSLVSIIHKINKKLPHKIIVNVKDIGYKLTL